MTTGEKIIIGASISAAAGLIIWWITKNNAASAAATDNEAVAVKKAAAKAQADADAKLKAGQSRVKTLLNNVKRTDISITEADSAETINQAFQTP